MCNEVSEGHCIRLLLFSFVSSGKLYPFMQAIGNFCYKNVVQVEGNERKVSPSAFCIISKLQSHG
jgi:hypothetical protein